MQIVCTDSGVFLGDITKHNDQELQMTSATMLWKFGRNDQATALPSLSTVAEKAMQLASDKKAAADMNFPIPLVKLLSLYPPYHFVLYVNQNCADIIRPKLKLF
jgi:hypothetical protein